MLNRVINVALRPKQEWPIIAQESTTVKALMVGLVVPLAAIGPLSQFFHGMFHTRWGGPPPLTWLLWGQIIGYVLTLAGVLLVAFVVEKLAPNFQSAGDRTQALKLVAYAQAPYWLASVLHLTPMLGGLSYLVGLYGLYVTYVGLPFVMKTPQDKALGYLVVVIVVLIVIYVIIGAITSVIVGTHPAAAWIR